MANASSRCFSRDERGEKQARGADTCFGRHIYGVVAHWSSYDQGLSVLVCISLSHDRPDIRQSAKWPKMSKLSPTRHCRSSKPETKPRWPVSGEVNHQPGQLRIRCLGSQYGDECQSSRRRPGAIGCSFDDGHQPGASAERHGRNGHEDDGLKEYFEGGWRCQVSQMETRIARWGPFFFALGGGRGDGG